MVYSDGIIGAKTLSVNTGEDEKRGWRLAPSYQGARNASIYSKDEMSVLPVASS